MTLANFLAKVRSWLLENHVSCSPRTPNQKTKSMELRLLLTIVVLAATTMVVRAEDVVGLPIAP